MRRQFLLLMLLIPVLLSAADLKVYLRNGSTGQAGDADQVILMDLSQGMMPIANLQDVKGEAIFTDLNLQPPINLLIQVTKGGVTYSGRVTELPAGMVGEWSASVTVYDQSDQVEALHVTIPFYYVSVLPDELYIQKRFVFENHTDPPKTLKSDEGIIRFHLPADSMRLDFITFKSGSMPLRVAQVPTERGYTITKALKPGTSELDVAYYVPYDPSETSIEEILHYPAQHFHLFVSPANIAVTGEGLENQGVDQANNMAIYAFTDVEVGESLVMTLSGEGIHPQRSQQSNQGRILVENRFARGFEISSMIIMTILLAASLGYAWNREDPEEEQESRRQALRAQRKELLQSYHRLQSDQNGVSTLEKDRVLNRLVSIYKALEQDRL